VFYIVLQINKNLTNTKRLQFAILSLHLASKSLFMVISPRQVNFFLFFKLPTAFWSGVRLYFIDQQQCVTTVRHNWFNSNPFKSLYFAVQTMAGELSTGVLVMQAVQESGREISMLVASTHAVFTKKATGRIRFTCNDGKQVYAAVQEAIKSNQGQIILLRTIGTNEKDEVVAEMNFEWTIKTKN
jgi:hypothetical protein